MKESKLYRVLKSLSSSELNRLDKFVSSPYFNSDERLRTLFSYYYEGVRSASFSDDNTVLANLMDDVDLSDSRIRLFKTKLLSLVQEFLAIEEFRSSPAEEDIHLLSSIRKKGLEELVSTATASAQKHLERGLDRSGSYYHHLYNLEQALYSFNKTEVRRVSRKNLETFNIQKILENLDLFYVGEKLKYHCSILMWEKLITVQELDSDISGLITMIEDDPKYKVPHIEIYLNIFKTLKFPEQDEHFESLKKLIDKEIVHFPVLEAKNILDAANNYCLGRINQGNEAYLRELFDLYLKGLSTQLLLSNGQISPWTFKNIVGTALRLQEYHWSKNFILEYGPIIQGELKDSIIALSQAQLEWYQKNYKATLLNLQQVEFKEFTLKINAEFLLLATYYELEEFTPLGDEIVTFKKFLRRQTKVSDSLLTFCKNFTNVLNKLINPRINHIQLTELRSFILEAKNIPSKSWLLEKVDELLGESSARS